MLRFGHISEFGKNEWAGYARVYFDELGISSYWLPLPSMVTKNIKDWTPILANTQVAVLMHPDGEDGYILGGVWCDTDTVPEWATEKNKGTEFPDGTQIYYDFDSHKLTVKIGGNGIIEFNGGSLGGLVKIESLVSNIITRENRINDIVAALTNLAKACSGVSTPLTGTVLAEFITSAIASIILRIPTTSQSDLENTMIRQ